MAKLDTTYYVLSQSQLYQLMSDAVAQTHEYIEQKQIKPQDAMEMAIGDVFAGLNRHSRNVAPVAPRFED